MRRQTLVEIELWPSGRFNSGEFRYFSSSDNGEFILCHIFVFPSVLFPVLRNQPSEVNDGVSTLLTISQPRQTLRNQPRRTLLNQPPRQHLAIVNMNSGIMVVSEKPLVTSLPNVPGGSGGFGRECHPPFSSTIRPWREMKISRTRTSKLGSP